MSQSNIQTLSSQVPDNPDTHIYLYAKGFYEKSDLYQDLKTIIGYRSCIEPEYISQTDIVLVLIDIVQYHLQQGNFKGNFLDFINGISPHSSWKFSDSNNSKFDKPNESIKYDFYDQLIKKCLSNLRLTNIDNIPGKLGKPNPEILPLNTKHPKGERCIL